MNEPNQSFVLYTNYYEILADLPNEKLGELFRAILEYKTTKKQPVVSVDLLVVFKFIKNQLDIDEEKYNKKRSKNADNGRKGGAPKGNQNAKKQPKTTQNKHNDNDNVNVNDNVLLFSNENNNRVDFLCGDEVEKIFKIYKEKCPDLQSMTFERRNKDMRKLIAEYLQETAFDYGYFEKICAKGNELREIAGNKIDLKMLIRNHIGINNGKYDNKASPGDKKGLTEDDINDLFD